MFFWIKRNKIVLDSFTYSEAAFNHFNISKASKAVPQWFKNLPVTEYTNPNKHFIPTMKNCMGFIEYFKNSFNVPAWDFMHFSMGVDRSPHTVCDSAKIVTHPQLQYTGFLDSSYHHFKIEVPWLIKNKEDTKFLLSKPNWCMTPSQFPEKWLHLPGIIDFRVQHSVNYNFMLKKPARKDENYVIIVEPGDPLFFIVPLTEKEIVIKTHLLSKEEFFEKFHLIKTPGPNRHNLVKRILDDSK